MLEVSYSPF